MGAIVWNMVAVTCACAIQIMVLLTTVSRTGHPATPVCAWGVRIKVVGGCLVLHNRKAGLKPGQIIEWGPNFHCLNRDYALSLKILDNEKHT